MSNKVDLNNENEELKNKIVELNDELIEEWEERDVLSIKECTNCPVQLACGGGCAAIAKNRTGKLHAPDCRPVEGLLELGIGLYTEIAIN